MEAKTHKLNQPGELQPNCVPEQLNLVDLAIENSWSKIAPFWPLQNLIAVNPLGGFDHLPFEQAVEKAQAYFQQSELPEAMEVVNRETIKWLQAFFDKGQATIQMPMREDGLLKAVRNLLPFDSQINFKKGFLADWFKHLPEAPSILVSECLVYLGISSEDYEEFLTLLLTTLPGWASHVQYRTDWAGDSDEDKLNPVSKEEYLAFRILLVCLFWPEARKILEWHSQNLSKVDKRGEYREIEKAEKSYQDDLLKDLSKVKNHPVRKSVDAQAVFCIDVRSEPFRRAFEAQGNYETFGFAGFFGVPAKVENTLTGKSHSSCPVLLKPSCSIKEEPLELSSKHHIGHRVMQGIRRVYQSLKYTFATPFNLFELLGVPGGLWMSARSLSPRLSHLLKKKLRDGLSQNAFHHSLVSEIPFNQRIAYAANALKMMGLVDHFAPIVLFCGHGSTTQNNAYASSLDCGACGGRDGAPNARALASILNDLEIRKALIEEGIVIPETTHFFGAKHDTTTDQLEIYDYNAPEVLSDSLMTLKENLEKARNQNSAWRLSKLVEENPSGDGSRETFIRSVDWAQVRPEWGLARNSAFIVGPRALSRELGLGGRCFLHSYDWSRDSDGFALRTILTAPMVVAHWINSQYLFSALDNVAFGGGNKTTKNITGKIGIIQGNASDLMNGLPLQSVFVDSKNPYHEPLRLMTVVYAKRSQIDAIVHEEEILQKLFGNGWVHLACIEPDSGEVYRLQRDFTWMSEHANAQKSASLEFATA